MKNKITIIVLLIVNLNFVYSQNTLKELTDKNKNWQLFSQEKIITIDINKTDNFIVNNLKVVIVWNKQLSYSKNIGYYGGIKSLTIFKNNKPLQTISNIEDNIALGTISINFYDYNLDGYLDFTIPIDCGKICWDKYYIFNPQKNKYENLKDWDYLRIQKINKIKKQILSEPDGNAFTDNRKLYQIKGLELTELKLKKTTANN